MRQCHCNGIWIYTNKLFIDTLYVDMKKKTETPCHLLASMHISTNMHVYIFMYVSHWFKTFFVKAIIIRADVNKKVGTSCHL